MLNRISRRYVIVTDGHLVNRHAKTAHGMLRYARDEIVAVIDRPYAGQNVADVLPALQRNAPIVASLQETLRYKPTSLLVGVATAGGVLPPNFREHVLAGVDAGLEIISGLHQLLRDDAEFVSRARVSGSRLWDVRVPPDNIPLFSGAAYAAPQIVALAVGSDCAVGKKSVMIELQRAAQAEGVRAEFVATGQTGVMIAGKGIAVDRVISDFISGATEQLILDVAADADYALVEGQGSIIHPAYGAVTLGLLYGSAPDVLVLCHESGRELVEDFDVPIPDLNTLRRMYESILAPIKRAACVAVALNTQRLDEPQARAAIEAAQRETGLPADDVVRFGGARLWTALSAAARHTPKWRARLQGARA